VAAQTAARAALDDLDWLRERAVALVRERDTLAAALGALPGLRVYPSAANFLLVACADGRRDAIWSGLLDRGILTRRFDAPQLAECLRVTVGTPEEHARLLAALREILLPSPAAAGEGLGEGGPPTTPPAADARPRSPYRP
jgi:histidinol-phosphate aminotransferase